MKVASAPSPRTYWARPGELLAGCYPGAKGHKATVENLSGLLKCGVSLIVNLMEENEVNLEAAAFDPYEETVERLAAERGCHVRCVRFPVRDGSVPDPGQMEDILGAIRSEIEKGGMVFVHSRGGWGRAGSAVGCYLVEFEGMTGEEALEQLAHLTSTLEGPTHPSPETREQRRFVMEWKRDDLEDDDF